jgi:class 3 adenylate cyclase
LLVLVSAVPAADAFFHYERYADYQKTLIKRVEKINPTFSRLVPQHDNRRGLTIQALTKLLACGFVAVLMWKGIHRKPVRAMILLLGFVSVTTDPPLAALLSGKAGNAMFMFLWAADQVHPLIVASLLRFAVLFPRPLSTTELQAHLRGPHPGILRRACRRLITAARRRFSPAALARVDAAVLFTLVGFLAVRRPAWRPELNYYASAAAMVFSIARLAAAALRTGKHPSRGGVSVPGPRQIAPALFGMVAIALLLQPAHHWVDSAARLVVVALLIGGGLRLPSRESLAIHWFDAAIVFALTTFMFVTEFTDWAWKRNSQIAAIAVVIAVIRLVAPWLRRRISRARGVSFNGASYAGALMIATYALAMATQHKWTSWFTEMILLLVTPALLAWMLRGSLLRFSELQLTLTRPFPVWSTGLVAYVISIALLVSQFTIIASIKSAASRLQTGEQVSMLSIWLMVAGGVVGAIGWVVTVSIYVGFLLLALKFLRVGYELGDATDRRQMLWIVEGIAASAAIDAVAAAAVFVLAGEVPPTVIQNVLSVTGSLNLPVILLSLGVAVFYHGAADPGRIIRHTAVFGAVFLISLFLFEGVENGIAAILSYLLGAEGAPGWVATFLAAGTAALAFDPVRRWCDAIIARYISAPAIDPVEAEPIRRSAVIVVTDLIGYGAATLNDESVAGTLSALFRQVVKNVAGACGGRVIERSRDFAILEFSDVASALTACRELFEQIRGADASVEREARLRAGLHAGDVLFAVDGGVTGRAVIIADRLREQASAGEVLLSDAAMAWLPEGLANGLDDLGTMRLRDVPEPQHCFRLRSVPAASVSGRTPP